MRKLGIGLLVGVVVVLIALAVRGQIRDESVAESARPVAAPAALQDVQPPSVSTDRAPSMVQPVARRPQSADTTRNRRPVVSDKVPNIVQPAAEVDEAAQDGATVLKRASAAYTNMRSMRADFVQRRQNPLLGSDNTSRGTLYQRKPDRFLMKFSDPAGDVIVGDGKYFWLYYPSVDPKQVLRSPAADADAGGVDLQAQFIGDPLRRFRYTYHGRQNVGGRPAHVLTLVPRQDLGYQTLKVWIDAADHLVRRFQITEQTGAVVEFQLNNLELNAQLGDNLFRFTPPAGARVVER